jgi:predicted HTH domain antitoxin
MEETKYATVNLAIPYEVLYAAKLRRRDLPQEVLQRLALSFYADGTLSLGQAARLAGMSYWAFYDLLLKKQIPYQYNEEDLEHDERVIKELDLI